MRPPTASAQRFTAKDPILFWGGTNLYAYVGNDPINFVDPTGLTVTCSYSQATGQLTRTDDGTGAQVVNHVGYAGIGAGLNNPAQQCTPNVGPLPQGSYTIGAGVNSPNTGPMTLPLQPAPANAMCGRDQFRIHGDNAAANFTASHGCIIMPPAVRNTINNAGGGTVTVGP